MGKAARVTNKLKRAARADTVGIVRFTEKQSEYRTVLVAQHTKDSLDDLAVVAKDVAGRGNCLIAAQTACEWINSRCYELGPPKIVHGYPVGTGGGIKGKRYAHAWVETTDMRGTEIVVDVSNGTCRMMVREGYYDLGSVTEEYVKRYTPDEYNVFCLLTGDIGP